MNANEPVAWMIKTLDGRSLMLYGEEQPPKFKEDVQYIPLYTAQPQIKVGCAECGVNGNHALYCVKCAEKYLKEKNIE